MGLILIGLGLLCCALANYYYRKVGVTVGMKLSEVEAALRRDRRPRSRAVCLALASMVLLVLGCYLQFLR
jgi:NADH:ubiquinone oxidoreductase subunit 2 (subunit N)